MAANEWIEGCYVQDSGAMATGWLAYNGNWYYLDEHGYKTTGWQEINGNWYYLYEDGRMAADTTVDGYYVDSSGVWVK